MKEKMTQESFEASCQMHRETIRPLIQALIGIAVLLLIMFLVYGQFFIWAFIGAVLALGAHFIISTSAEKNDLICPKCKLNFVYDLSKVLKRGKCPRCRTDIFPLTQ
jgi:hypothetical protein